MLRAKTLPALMAFAVLNLVGCGGLDSGATVSYGSNYGNGSTYGNGTGNGYNQTLPTTPVVYPTPYVDPYASAYPGAPYATGSVLPVVPTPQPSVAPSTAPAPSVTPAPSYPSAYSLRILDLKKSTSGLMWFKRASVALQVHNPLFVATQTGRLHVTWYLEAQVVGTPQEIPVQLAPAEIRSYSFKADVRSDDVVVKLAL
jgi:hypothetical protein